MSANGIYPFLMAAILKIQDGGLPGICANGNIDFRIPHRISFPKMYSFQNLHKIPAKANILT